MTPRQHALALLDGATAEQHIALAAAYAMLDLADAMRELGNQRDLATAIRELGYQVARR